MEHTLPAPFTGEDAPEHEPALVIAQANSVGVPVDTLGQPVEEASYTDINGYKVELVLVKWFMDGPGQPTLKAMRPTEFRYIEEG